nr:MAG TPA: hypothetical protein [Caudoviricetes sp.]
MVLLFQCSRFLWLTAAAFPYMARIPVAED